TLSRRSSEPLPRSPIPARNKAVQTTAYWNEYDYPSDGGGADEPYTIAFDADDETFPGQHRISRALAYLGEKSAELGLWRPSTPGATSTKGERRALLGSRASDGETADEDLEAFDADGFPLGYETHYATFPSIATQRLSAQRSRLLLLALVACYVSSALLLGISGILVATGRNRLRAEVDAGVIAGVVAALGFVGVGVRIGALRWEEASVWERVGVVVGFVGGCLAVSSWLISGKANQDDFTDEDRLESSKSHPKTAPSPHKSPFRKHHHRHLVHRPHTRTKTLPDIHSSYLPETEIMATMAPISASKPIQPFRFLALSPELRNKIYDLVLYLDRPIYLTSTTEICKRQTRQHIADCPFTEHPDYPNVVRGDGEPKRVTWCIDDFNDTKRRLEMPRSVLALRHVCKQISNETRFTFFAINEFYFRNAKYAETVLSSIAMANANLTAAIQIMGFRFHGDGAPKLYHKLEEACPNIRVLKVSMNIEDRRVIIPGERLNTLRNARGVHAFATYLSRLEKLETFEITGMDVLFRDSGGPLGQVPVGVDINDPEAIGPWFRYMIKMGRRERERPDWKAVKMARIEKERKDIAKKEAKGEGDQLVALVNSMADRDGAAKIDQTVI
ncbi:hypothetical protein V498_07063, partial [Pseudogymnoascus sp. VKM F-4517 (FW-2822)]